jgi:hypothetical protein
VYALIKQKYCLFDLRTYIFILKRVGEVIQECKLCTSGILKKETQENAKTCVPQHDLQQKSKGSMKKINLPSDYGDFRNKVILGIGALRCSVTCPFVPI